MTQWRLITDTDQGIDYAALLKDNTLYDLRIKCKDELFSIGDICSVLIDRYYPKLNAYSVKMPDNVVGHLPAPKKTYYKEGEFILAQIQRLAFDDKDILLTTNIDQKETDQFTKSPNALKKIQSAPSLTDQLRLSYPSFDMVEDKDDFDHHDLWPEIDLLKNNTLTVDQGVSLTIETTTALTAIDVNNTGEVSATKANIIAANEISRQIRIRNIGGIILVDFINMKESKDKKGVIAKLKKVMADDPHPHQIHGFTALNLLEISRKRIGNPISAILR